MQLSNQPSTITRVLFNHIKHQNEGKWDLSGFDHSIASGAMLYTDWFELSFRDFPTQHFWG